MLLWYKKPPAGVQDHTRIIDFTFRFPMLHGTVRHGKFHGKFHGNCFAAGIRA
jgi:hypothetical protein